MALDHAYYNAVREEITAALQGVLNKHGLASARATKITVQLGGDSFDVKVECVKQGGKTKEAAMYEMLHSHDEKLPALGSKFRNGAKDHTIVGATGSGQKIITEAGGKQFVWRRAIINDFAQRLGLSH